MSRFDQEMALFKEIIARYRPVPGYHLVLDLASYRSGKENIRKYEINCEKYWHYINVECNEKNIETVLITSNTKNQIKYSSKYLFANFSYDRMEFTEIEDLTPRRKIFNRTMRQEIELLCYELNNPQPVKPDC